MSMSMTFEQLVELGNLIGELDSESDLQVKMVAYKGHDVYLDHDDAGYKIKSITDKQQGAAVLREPPNVLAGRRR